MTVSNPATLSSANTEFSGNGTLSALVRGGSYVSSSASSTISTTVSGLALSQFNGVTKPAVDTPLSINGKTYSAGMIVSSGSGTIGYQFTTTNATWTVNLNRAGGTGSPAAGSQDSGAVPTGATQVRLTLTYQSGTSVTTNNTASTATTLSSTGVGAGIVSPSILQNNPGSQCQYNLKIEYLNSGGTVISTTNIALAPSWSGNV